MKKLFTLIFAGLMALSVVGCSQKEDGAKPNSEQTTAENKELEDFDVVLDWYPNAIHSFIYDAIDKGYYAEEGLNVNIQFPSSTSDAISLTAAGKADVGIYYMHYVIEARAKQNIPIKSIGAVVQSPLNIVLSLKDKNITEPKDLIGKKIGASGSELNELFVKTIIENAGGKVDEVDIVDVGFDLMSSMTTGNVDATLGCMVNHEVPQMEKNGFELNYFDPSDYGIPKNYELLFVTSDKQIEQERERLEGFLRATQRGFDDMKNNPEEALQLLLTHQNEENFPLDPDVEKKSMDILLPVMETPEAPFLSQSEQMWQENIDWLYDLGFIEEKITPSDVMVDLLKK